MDLAAALNQHAGDVPPPQLHAERRQGDPTILGWGDPDL